MYGQFGTLDPSTPPPRIAYCGAEFHKSNQVVSSTHVDNLPTIHRVGIWLSGAPTVAQAIGPAGPYNGPVCPMSVYLGVDHDHYRAYFRCCGP